MNIVYLDDEQSELTKFERSFLLRDETINVIGLIPKYSIDETYELIMNNGEVDAVISDYELSDSCDVSYTGAELIKFLIEAHPLLSCFVLTAFENNAVKSDSVDVYQVYPKSVLSPNQQTHTAEHEVSFHEKVAEQVDKNKRKLLNFQKEHEELLAERNTENWTSEKEERLIICDNILEHPMEVIKSQVSLKRMIIPKRS
jgi:DNA-binding NarL/FixJ family response regulator